MEAKDKVDRLIEQFPQVWKTRASFFSWLRGCLRRGIWEKYPPKLIFKNSQCKPPTEGYTGKAKSGVECALTKQWTGKSQLEVDHIEGHVSLKDIDDITPFILHLLAEEGSMQLVSKEAHKVKNYSDRMGLTYEEAEREKEVIKFKKLPVAQQKDILTNQCNCCIISNNAKGRIEQYRQWLIEKEKQ